jgi:hypothetical protein
MYQPSPASQHLSCQRFQKSFDIGAVLDGNENMLATRAGKLFASIGAVKPRAGRSALYACDLRQGRSDTDDGAPKASAPLDIGRHIGRHALLVEVEQRPRCLPVLEGEGAGGPRDHIWGRAAVQFAFSDNLDLVSQFRPEAAERDRLVGA